MAVSVARDTTRFVAIELIADFVLFPVWWYTAGFVRALRSANSWLLVARRNLGVGVWAKNIFTPMFAQYDFWGRFVSFLVRIANVVFRSFALAVAAVIVLAGIVAYLAFPLLVVWLVVGKTIAVFSA